MVKVGIVMVGMPSGKIRKIIQFNTNVDAFPKRKGDWSPGSCLTGSPEGHPHAFGSTWCKPVPLLEPR